LIVVIVSYQSFSTIVRQKIDVDFELKLRKLKQNGGDMLKPGNENSIANEFNKFLLYTVEFLDMAVMKYIDDDCPILHRQEAAHAKLHREGIAVENEAEKVPITIIVIRKVLETLMLRLGRPFGCACALGVEEVISEVFNYIDILSNNIPRMKNFQSKLILFHIFEEIEHGPLTVQSLKKKTTLFMRLLAFLPLCVIYILLFISPPILAVLTSPFILLKRNPITTVLDIWQYYAVMVPVTLFSIFRLVSVYLSPWARPSQADHLRMQKHFQERVTQEGIEYEIVETEKYALQY
jgi:predicted metal-dependent hydrolase